MTTEALRLEIVRLSVKANESQRYELNQLRDLITKNVNIEPKFVARILKGIKRDINQA